MASKNNANEDEHHSNKVHQMMNELVDYLRSDIPKLAHPQLKAIFETSAEVVTGLMKTIKDFQGKNEEAWRG
jgi:hypothetical protein